MKTGSKLCKLSKQIGKEDVDQWLLAVLLERLKEGYESQHNTKYINEASQAISKLGNENIRKLRNAYIQKDGLDGILDEIDQLMIEERELHSKQTKNQDDKDALLIIQKKLRAYGVVVHEDACKLGIGTKDKPRALTTPQRFAAHETHSKIQNRLGERIIWHEQN